jgi:hypothetical protein
MLISDIKEMERIVENNPELYWDGWNVIRATQSDHAEYENSGVFNRATGKWYKKEVYPADGIGWEIPDSVMLYEE